MADYPIRIDLQKLGLPERAIRVLEKAARIVDLLEGQSTLDADLTDTALLAVLTEARVDDLEAFEAAGPYAPLAGATFTGPVQATEYRVSGTKVVGAQGAAVADAAGGATIDAEARTAINTLLARLRTHGLIVT